MTQTYLTYSVIVCIVFVTIGALVYKKSCECGTNRGQEMHVLTFTAKENVTDFSSEMYFEPLVTHNFPTESSSSPRIPHIIHLFFKDVHIPTTFKSHISTIVNKNPKWTYYFWSDESSRRFLAERFPKFLFLWDYNKIPMAIAVRYFVLYEFGGFYVDLDIECKRPLDNVTLKYACIFPLEPFEQSVFRIHIPYLFSDAIMGCRPKHPFLKQMIETLHQFQPMLPQLDVIGPCFLTSQFIRYNNITADYVYKLKQRNESNSPYFYKGVLPEEHNDAVYVPNTQYFMNSLAKDWINEKDYKRICSVPGSKGILEHKACNELKRRLSQTDRDMYAYTDHHWLLIDKRTGSFHLKEIITKYTVY